LFRDNFKILILEVLFKIFRINPLLYAYNRIGILKYQNEHVTGEKFMIAQVLKSYFEDNEQLVFFDVGANVGNYSKLLARHFSRARIYSFEPMPVSYSIASENLKQYPNVVLLNFGFSSNINNLQKIHTYAGDNSSSHASLYKEVFTEIHHAKKIEEVSIKLDTIDNFCTNNNIEKINFLKIDTEGHEMEVLKGAINMITSGRIDIIQFEFNEMHVIARVFFKDFYELLSQQYFLYRLNTDSLIPLKGYDTFYEVFKFQNIVAVNRKLCLSGTYYIFEKRR